MNHPWMSNLINFTLHISSLECEKDVLEYCPTSDEFVIFWQYINIWQFCLFHLAFGCKLGHANNIDLCNDDYLYVMVWIGNRKITPSNIILCKILNFLCGVRIEHKTSPQVVFEVKQIYLSFSSYSLTFSYIYVIVYN